MSFFFPPVSRKHPTRQSQLVEIYVPLRGGHAARIGRHRPQRVMDEKARFDANHQAVIDDSGPEHHASHETVELHWTDLRYRSVLC